MGKFSGVFKSSNTRCQGIKGGLRLKKEIFFSISTTMVVPKNTPLFHPKSDKEANRAIQVVVDVQACCMYTFVHRSAGRTVHIGLTEVSPLK